MPATAKGREIVATLRNKIEEKRKAVLEIQEVDLSGIPDPTLRTLFFTKLASEFPNSTLNDVLRVKLQGSNSSSTSETEEENGDDNEIDLDAEMTKKEEAVAGVLRGAALSGQDLFGTSVFQDLRQRGFYITSITWRSRLQEVGNPIVEFNAEFEDVETCTSFRYSANTWKVRRSTGEYNESFGSIPPPKRAELLRRLQQFAMLTVQSIAAQTASAGSSVDKSGGDSEPS
jgi:hypothetical protein